MAQSKSAKNSRIASYKPPNLIEKERGKAEKKNQVKSQ